MKLIALFVLFSSFMTSINASQYNCELDFYNGDSWVGNFYEAPVGSGRFSLNVPQKGYNFSCVEKGFTFFCNSGKDGNLTIDTLAGTAELDSVLSTRVERARAYCGINR